MVLGTAIDKASQCTYLSLPIPSSLTAILITVALRRQRVIE